jgi:hypothetical protein
MADWTSFEVWINKYLLYQVVVVGFYWSLGLVFMGYFAGLGFFLLFKK